MVTNAPGSANTADADSLAGMLRFVLTKFLQNTDDMLPAQVIAYDRTTNRAQVQPLIQFVTTANEVVSRAQVASIPVLQLGGGGFVASFPIQTGDLGWIKANDRDISFFKKTLKNSSPNTQRKHSFEDALFIPDIMMRATTIASEDVNNLVIQNLAGTVKIAWWSTFLKIISPGVGIGGTPNANAILDVQSTTKAFMPPRMTTGQRDAIPSPTEGMVIWNLTTHGLNVYNGSIWG
jgi:hypothetical protein